MKESFARVKGKEPEPVRDENVPPATDEPAPYQLPTDEVMPLPAGLAPEEDD